VYTPVLDSIARELFVVYIERRCVLLWYKVAWIGTRLFCRSFIRSNA